MAYTTVNKSTDYFNTSLWSGNSSTQTITGVGFQPDLVWLKQRSSTQAHALYDAIRGVTKYIASNTDGAEGTEAQGLTAFNSDGYALGTDEMNNATGQTYVGWNWKANGAGSSNTDGSITSTVSANTTAGFSVVTYTGAGGNVTVGHGLGVVPKIILIKRLDSANSWIMYNKIIGHSSYFVLNTNAAKASSSTFFNATSPTSSVFTVGNDAGVNGGSNTYVAYCFADITGYSSLGQYGGNANSDGTFVYTGFKPAWLVVKREDSTDNWYMKDSIRSGSGNPNGSNPIQTEHPSCNSNAAENKASAFGVDFLSNGFKIRGSDSGINGNDGNPYYYVYMCFAQAPLVGSNDVPCIAR